MPRNYSRTRAWGCAVNAGGWLPAPTAVIQKRKAYHLSDEGFEEYKKFLSDPDQKKFCFKGYYYVEVKEQDDKELLGAMGRVVYE